jgi:DNA-binding Xre family transcriptional regulator
MIRLKVKEIARQKHISQQRLALISEVGLSTIQSIYQRPTETNITLFTLDKIAIALGVDPSELIEGVYEDER